MAGINSAVSIAPQFTTKVDNTDPNNIYIGQALIGTASAAAKWQIRKIITSSSVLSILWANGSTKSDQIWDNRSGLSYS